MNSKNAAVSRKAWEKSQREERIIDIAKRLFVENGVEKTTIAVVADAAGYNKRTIYLYFKDKEDLFLAVACRCLTSLKEQLAVASGSVESLARAFFDFAGKKPEYMDLIMAYESRHFVYHESERHLLASEREAACQSVSQEILDLLTAQLETAVKDGDIQTDLPARALVLLLWGQVFGVVQVMRMRKLHFKEVFGIGQTALFDRFVKMLETALIR